MEDININEHPHSVIVLVERNTNRVWTQGATLEDAQREADRIAGQPSEWREVVSGQHDFTAYCCAPGEYTADDTEFLERHGEVYGYWKNTDTVYPGC